MEIKEVQKVLNEVRGFKLKELREMLDPLPVERVYDIYTALNELEEYVDISLSAIAYERSYKNIEEKNWEEERF